SRVPRPGRLSGLEDARRVLRLDRMHVDAEVRDLLERSLTRELPQEADAGDDRDVRRLAARDAGLERGRVVLTDRFVGGGHAGLRLEGVEHLLEAVLLAAAPQRHDVDRAAGRGAADRGRCRAATATTAG